MSKWTKEDIPPLTGKVAIVTGGTGGLGFETALGLAEAGATVLLVGRNEEKGDEALARIKRLVPTASVTFGKADLGSLSSVSEFCAWFNAGNSPLHILVNNAGVCCPPARLETSDGLELQFGTNYLAHFALTLQLLPALKRSGGGRVVNLSSLAHWIGRIQESDLQFAKSYSPIRAYAQSKLALLLFTGELQRRSEAGGWGLNVFSAHPGYSRTDLLENSPGGRIWQAQMAKGLASIFSQDAAAGALPTLFAATAAEAKPGSCYGPQSCFGLKGQVGEAGISSAAKDSSAAADLWSLSLGLAKL